MHLGGKWIYGVQPVNILKNACRVWSKRGKKQDGRQRTFEQNIFLKINCNMSFLTDFGGVEPIAGPQISIISFFDLQAAHEGQNMVSSG